MTDACGVLLLLGWLWGSRAQSPPPVALAQHSVSDDTRDARALYLHLGARDSCVTRTAYRAAVIDMLLHA